MTIRHTTRFVYDQPARASFNEVRLSPRNDEQQNLISFRLTIDPAARTTSYRDHFGTLVQAFNLWAPHDHLTITGESAVVTYPRPPLPQPGDPRGGNLTALDDPELIDEQAEWLHESALASGGDPLTTFAQHVRTVCRPTSVVELIQGVNEEVHRRFTYATGSSYVSSTVDDLLKRGTGVCQDFAHLAIATLRDLGVPARYVSGYFYAGSGEPEPDTPLRLESHAWIEALIPGYGWIAMDPTNACPADERHVTVAIGRDYTDVAPVRGTLLGGDDQVMEVAVTMIAPSTPFPTADPASRHPLTAGPSRRESGRSGQGQTQQQQ